MLNLPPFALPFTRLLNQPAPQKISALEPIRHWLNKKTIPNATVAHFICRMIPAQCPFEREIRLGGQRIAQIPPLCKLNPLYEEVVSLRFRALCYLADECNEDISCYC
ncbi:MAG: Mo-dependent nitrogenase C-terminal domain-containing protein [Spirulinaceae cyanobacterium]